MAFLGPILAAAGPLLPGIISTVGRALPKLFKGDFSGAIGTISGALSSSGAKEAIGQAAFSGGQAYDKYLEQEKEREKIARQEKRFERPFQLEEKKLQYEQEKQERQDERDRKKEEERERKEEEKIRKEEERERKKEEKEEEKRRKKEEREEELERRRQEKEDKDAEHEEKVRYRELKGIDIPQQADLLDLQYQTTLRQRELFPPPITAVAAPGPLVPSAGTPVSNIPLSETDKARLELENQFKRNEETERFEKNLGKLLPAIFKSQFFPSKAQIKYSEPEPTQDQVSEYVKPPTKYIPIPTKTSTKKRGKVSSPSKKKVPPPSRRNRAPAPSRRKR